MILNQIPTEVEAVTGLRIAALAAAAAEEQSVDPSVAPASVRLVGGGSLMVR